MGCFGKTVKLKRDKNVPKPRIIASFGQKIFKSIQLPPRSVALVTLRVDLPNQPATPCLLVFVALNWNLEEMAQSVENKAAGEKGQ